MVLHCWPFLYNPDPNPVVRQLDSIWFIFAFILPWFAKDLNAFSFLGFPLGYYFIVQGSLIVFVLLIFFQNWRQDAIDDEAGVGSESDQQ